MKTWVSPSGSFVKYRSCRSGPVFQVQCKVVRLHRVDSYWASEGLCSVRYFPAFWEIFGFSLVSICYILYSIKYRQNSCSHPVLETLAVVKVLSSYTACDLDHVTWLGGRSRGHWQWALKVTNLPFAPCGFGPENVGVTSRRRHRRCCWVVTLCNVLLGKIGLALIYCDIVGAFSTNMHQHVSVWCITTFQTSLVTRRFDGFICLEESVASLWIALSWWVM